LSGFDYPDSIKKLMAEGYNLVNNVQVLDESYAQSLGWSNPAGGMYSSLRDMMKFTTHLVEMDGSLSPNGYEKYFLAGAPLPDGVSSYGRSGWEVAYANGFQTLTKGGLYGGFGTTLALIPQLKLGMFTWINLDSGIVPSQVSAYAMNVAVTYIKKEITENIAKHHVPAFAKYLVGSYAFAPTGTDVLFFKTSPQTEHTGIFIGAIAMNSVFFVYDEKTTEALNDNNQCAFRYRSLPEDGDSCFDDAGSGFDDAVVIFKYDDTTDRWNASLPEIALYDLIGPESPAPSQVSSSTPTSASSHHFQSSSASTLSVSFAFIALILLAYLL